MIASHKHYRLLLSSSIRTIILIISCLAVSSVHAESYTISQSELLEKLESGSNSLILDVRTPAEFRAGHIPGAINIPYDQLENQLAQILESKNQEVITYCEQGPRAYIAESILQKEGFPKIRHLIGDMGLWRANKLPTHTLP